MLFAFINMEKGMPRVELRIASYLFLELSRIVSFNSSVSFSESSLYVSG